ncbi:hypothetical protein [Metabacillus fastidiosus]|uniref:hypothetical protein n=2 Tax=Metabacillus fastidiosus TaxID=1458 RepID=UPI002E1B1C6C|nr:hypothetical protein [Metabacillus fastidiosus]
MHDSSLKNPIWAWFVLIGGLLFLIQFFPTIIITLVLLFQKPADLTSFSIIYMTMALCIVVIAVWAIKRALYALKTYNKVKKEQQQNFSGDSSKLITAELSKRKKTIWPWVVIGSGVLLLISAGPGVIMLPIMPIFLAGMASDAGPPPAYVPFLILTIGYGIIIGYTILFIKAVKKIKG